jgi:hypothetical protein
MKLLFARIGRTLFNFWARSKKKSVTDVVADVESFDFRQQSCFWQFTKEEGRN